MLIHLCLTKCAGKFFRFYDRCVKENQEFALSKKRELRELRQKEALLLSKPREVKRLSDIITLEYKVMRIYHLSCKLFKVFRVSIFLHKNKFQ